MRQACCPTLYSDREGGGHPALPVSGEGGSPRGDPDQPGDEMVEHDREGELAPFDAPDIKYQQIDSIGPSA